MHLELITLLGQKLDEPVYGITIPTAAGEISVFPGHERLVTLAVPGVLSVRRHRGDSDSHLQYFAISGGIVEISPQQVRILVDEAESGEDILESESKAALERALKLRQEAGDQVSIEKAQAHIDRHAVRLKVAQLRRRHRRG